MENIAGTDRLSTGVALNIIHFADLDGFDPAILREVGWRRIEFAPIVGGSRLYGDLGRRHDEIGLAEGPLRAVHQREGRRHVRGISLRSAGLGPSSDLCDFRLSERIVV